MGCLSNSRLGGTWRAQAQGRSSSKPDAQCLCLGSKLKLVIQKHTIQLPARGCGGDQAAQHLPETLHKYDLLTEDQQGRKGWGGTTVRRGQQPAET